MRISAFIGASALVVAISTAGFAATTPAKPVVKPAERCAALQSQFDAALPAHQTAKRLAAAQKLRADGGKLCDGKHYAAGERKILAALRDLGVKAKI